MVYIKNKRIYVYLVPPFLGGSFLLNDEKVVTEHHAFLSFGGFELDFRVWHAELTDDFEFAFECIRQDAFFEWFEHIQVPAEQRS